MPASHRPPYTQRIQMDARSSRPPRRKHRTESHDHDPDQRPTCATASGLRAASMHNHSDGPTGEAEQGGGAQPRTRKSFTMPTQKQRHRSQIGQAVTCRHGSYALRRGQRQPRHNHRPQVNSSHAAESHWTNTLTPASHVAKELQRWLEVACDTGPPSDPACSSWNTRKDIRNSLGTSDKSAPDPDGIPHVARRQSSSTA